MKVKGHIATRLQAAFLNESTFKKGGGGGVKLYRKET